MTISPENAILAATAADLEELDRRHLIHPHQRSDRDERIVVVRGQGSTVWDARGNEYLDVTGGGNWLSQVGHGRRELVEVAASQTAELEYFTGFNTFSNDKAIRLAERLAALAPAGLNKVFFTCGGSESVDTVIKIARLYHHRQGEPERTWIIARHFGYHGATYGGGTATGFPPMQHAVGPNLPHIEKVSPPWPYRAPEMFGGEDTTDFLVRELEQTIERIGPGQIAAMIGEPIMAGGGVHTPPPDYWPRIREVLSRHGILLIADEVVTGYGRTGAWFDSEERGMAADLITSAKGISSGYVPLGAVLIRDDIGDVIANHEGFFHGYTYFGHSVACAVALANLDLIEKEGLLASALVIGDWFRTGLAAAADLPTVGDIRVEGATIGIELVADKETKAPLMPPPLVENVTDEIRRAHGVIARPYGNIVVLSPPLVLTEDEAARASEAIVAVLTRLNPDGTLS